METFFKPLSCDFTSTASRGETPVAPSFTLALGALTFGASEAFAALDLSPTSVADPCSTVHAPSNKAELHRNATIVFFADLRETFIFFRFPAF